MEKIRKIFEILTGKNNENEMQQEIEEKKRCENCERLSKIIEELKKQIYRNNQEFEVKINEANTKIEVLEGTIEGLLAKRFGQSNEKSN